MGPAKVLYIILMSDKASKYAPVLNRGGLVRTCGSSETVFNKLESTQGCFSSGEPSQHTESCMAWWIRVERINADNFVVCATCKIFVISGESCSMECARMIVQGGKLSWSRKRGVCAFVDSLRRPYANESIYETRAVSNVLSRVGKVSQVGFDAESGRRTCLQQQ